MNKWHCRIGKVTPKEGLILLDQPFKRPALNDEDREAAHIGLDNIFNWAEGTMAAIAIVSYNFDGSFNRFTRIHIDAPFGETMLPSIFAEILRRDTMRTEAQDVFYGDF